MDRKDSRVENQFKQPRNLYVKETCIAALGLHEFNYIIAIGMLFSSQVFLCLFLLDFYCTFGYGPSILETFVCKFASYSLT